MTARAGPVAAAYPMLLSQEPAARAAPDLPSASRSLRRLSVWLMASSQTDRRRLSLRRPRCQEQRPVYLVQPAHLHAHHSTMSSDTACRGRMNPTVAREPATSIVDGP